MFRRQTVPNASSGDRNGSDADSSHQCTVDNQRRYDEAGRRRLPLSLEVTEAVLNRIFIFC